MPRAVRRSATAHAGKESSPRLDRQQAVTQLVDAAINLLAKEGFAGIKARTIADAAGLSTIAVYHHLGGVPELIAAIIDRGFRELGEALQRIPLNDDPVTSLFAMALECYRFAQANPHLYDLMFGLAVRGGYRPSDAAKTTVHDRANNFQHVYAHLLRSCHLLAESGRIRPSQDPEAIAQQLWIAVHGFVTLQLGDYLTLDDPVRCVLLPMMTNIAIGLGDDPQRANASNAAAIEALAGNSAAASLTYGEA